MRMRYLIGNVAMLCLLLSQPVAAAIDTAANEARISALEAKVAKLEALLEQRYRELDQSCARTEDVEEALAGCASMEQVEEALAIRFRPGFDMLR